MKSDNVHGPLAARPPLHNAYALFRELWNIADVGGSPRLRLLPHRMHVSFWKNSRGDIEASVRNCDTVRTNEKHLCVCVCVCARVRACVWGPGEV